MNNQKINLSVSIIVPVFNEEQAVGLVLTELRDKMMGQEFDWEIIAVNDGSTDKTGEIIKNIDGVRLVENGRNIGYGGAIKAGVRVARYDYIAWYDSDGQHQPDDLINILTQARENDMVVGKRQKKGNHRSWLRRPGLAVIYNLANYLAGFKIPDLNSGLRVMKREYFLKYEGLFSNSFSLSTTSTLAFLQAGLKIKYVPIVAKPRIGQSTVKQARHGMMTILLILRLIMAFNPLKIFVPISTALFLGGLVFSIYGIIGFSRLPVSGAIIILTAIILFFNGLLADQITSLKR